LSTKLIWFWELLCQTVHHTAQTRRKQGKFSQNFWSKFQTNLGSEIEGCITWVQLKFKNPDFMEVGRGWYQNFWSRPRMKDATTKLVGSPQLNIGRFSGCNIQYVLCTGSYTPEKWKLPETVFDIFTFEGRSPYCAIHQMYLWYFSTW
jgi:hypothetical protein